MKINFRKAIKENKLKNHRIFQKSMLKNILKTTIKNLRKLKAFEKIAKFEK